MSGREKCAARLAEITKKTPKTNLKDTADPRALYTESLKRLYSKTKDKPKTTFEKFEWQRNDVIESNDGVKFCLRKGIIKCAFYQVRRSGFEPKPAGQPVGGANATASLNFETIYLLTV